MKKHLMYLAKLDVVCLDADRPLIGSFGGIDFLMIRPSGINRIRKMCLQKHIVLNNCTCGGQDRVVDPMFERCKLVHVVQVEHSVTGAFQHTDSRTRTGSSAASVLQGLQCRFSS